MARKQRAPEPPPEPSDEERGLGAAAVVPWIAFWGWVALDSALAYRRSQAALDSVIEAAPVGELKENPPSNEPQARRWLLWSPGTVDHLRDMQNRARFSMIGAPVIALLGSLLISRLGPRRKP